MLPVRRAVVLLLALALLLSVGGCGQDPGAKGGEPKPDKATVACRQQWRALGEEVAGNDADTDPSALGARWTNLSATVDYYATSATSGDCKAKLADQREAVTALTAFAESLRPWDVEFQLTRVQGAAQTYATSPRPPAPTPAKGKKGKKTKKAPARAPKPADVAKALAVLTAQAPVATEQQGPAWQQARVTDLADPAAVAKARKDLAFLSSESPAYRASSAALTVIQRAIGSSPKGD